jgi:hypothetical protein
MPVKTVGEERMSNKTDIAPLTGSRTRSPDQESGPIEEETIMPTRLFVTIFPTFRRELSPPTS